MTPRKVIVFGPTGSVGSAVARTAHEQGAQVVLAMRDPSKPIPQLDASKSGVYERVQADLTQPDTVHTAVTSTGAQHAFIYIAFGSPDNMRSSIQALKDAGIQSVVFLSSFSVQGDLHAIASSDVIAAAHAQVEIVLQDVFGTDAFVALRPAFFASNSSWWTTQIAEGEVQTSFPDVQADFISPDDIGAVGGIILAGSSPVTTHENTVSLVGPESLSVREAIKVIATAFGKDVQVTKVSEEECVQVLITKAHLPPPLAAHLVAGFAQLGDGDNFLSAPTFKESRGNIERYLGRPPTRFHEWVDLHKEQLRA